MCLLSYVIMMMRVPKVPFVTRFDARIASLLSRARTADAILVFDSVGAKRLPLAGSTVSRTAHGSASQLPQSLTLRTLGICIRKFLRAQC